ncbi:MAG: TetR/AcrR family transcriptional regulator [Deltaproteobacteria bacterium]|nr:TetR/AcrR family transcriptional regulator [Deltaproteobacteria bacterium]MCW5802780.1 TetR/AcrR family transcriptional regulator [Deltaproteobacteria bacterium]
MPRAALQPDEVEAFRRRAGEAATRLFAAQGYEAVTLRAVAAELGVSAMTPYRYIAGKDELIALVRTRAFQRFADELERASAAVADPIRRLRVLKKAYLSFAVRRADEYRIMFELRGAADDERWPELAREATRAFGALLDAVRAAIATRAITGDAATVAHLLWAGAHGLASLRLAGRIPPARFDRLADIDHELDGFRKQRRRRKT